MPITHGDDLHHEDVKSWDIKTLVIAFDERKHYHSQVLDGLILLGAAGRLKADSIFRVPLVSTRRGPVSF